MLSDLCAEAERSGAGALWAIDHLFWPRPMLECLTTLAVAATATRAAVLGSCVLQLPLRQPAAVAKQATALQLLSGGRFVLGVGVGSHPGEYERAGVGFASRGHRIDQGIAALRQAWDAGGAGGDPAAASTVGTPGYRQAPSSSPVPVWVGGSSGAAIGRAARSGDGWIPLFVSSEEYAAGLRRLGDAVAGAGRPEGAVTAAVVVVACVGDEREAPHLGAAWLSSLYGIPPRAFRRHLVAGPADRCAEEIQRYIDAGAEHVAVMVADDRPLDHFAELVGALPAPAGRAAGGCRPDLMEVPA